MCAYQDSIKYAYLEMCAYQDSISYTYQEMCAYQDRISYAYKKICAYQVSILYVYDEVCAYQPSFVLYQTKHSFNVSMLSFAYSCVRLRLRGCDQGGGLKDSKGMGEASIMQDETVDLQHGTRVDGDSHLCI
jgi:hypothetical protein